MSFITWDKSFRINVAEIDQQHEKLVGMINFLHVAMQQGKGKDVMERIIKGLLDYALIHFRTEEKYFAQYGYPDAASHKQEHAAFVEQASQFGDDFQKGKVAMSLEVMNFLTDWLREHVQGCDKKFGAFANAKGLK